MSIAYICGLPLLVSSLQRVNALKEETTGVDLGFAIGLEAILEAFECLVSHLTVDFVQGGSSDDLKSLW